MTVQGLINHLQQFNQPDEEIAYILWTRLDVYQEAREMGLSIDDLIADEVLDRMHNHADCEFGMTWTTIRETLLITLNERGMLYEAESVV